MNVSDEWIRMGLLATLVVVMIAVLKYPKKGDRGDDDR
ncbi:hypothetical protein NNO_1302 [Hydrogenimonas sp.]|nr:hypothetical protein NNO_1302 [Hydrogenimonas sp.]